MKKKIIFIVVSVVLLLSLTVSAMAIKVGTFEFGDTLFSHNNTTKKVIVSSATGTSLKKIRNVTSWAYFDGTHPLHISYSQSYSGTYTINGEVGVNILDVVSAKASFSYSWTSGEVSAYSWDINKGDKVGKYNIQYKMKFNMHPYKYYTRVSNVFWTDPWSLKQTGTILDKGPYSPYFTLGYSSN